MTREEIKIILDDCQSVSYGPDGAYEYFCSNEATERILAALEKEREGEVVLVRGDIQQVNVYANKKIQSIRKQLCQRGSLIFRPDKSTKEST